MTGRVRQLAALLVLVVAVSAVVATNLAYAPLDDEWTDRVTLGAGHDAVLRRLTIAISGEALPATEGLLSGGTYGPVSAIFPEVDGLEVAVIGAAAERPTFEPAGEHVLLDSASCEFEEPCRRSVDLVIRLPGARAATEVEWTLRAGVFVPGGQLPEGAELTVHGLDQPSTPVAVHDVSVALDGQAVLDPSRPVALTVDYAPAVGTHRRLHQVTLGVAYDGAQLTTTGPTAMTIVLSPAGAEEGEEIELTAGADAVRELQPLETCIASCSVGYELVLRPGNEAADPPETATWSLNGWLFVLSDPAAAPPVFEVRGSQAEPAEG
jgi:hypothetical protein